MSRVLVAEKLAESGLEAMRAAGLEVDEQLDLSPADLLVVVRGAAALGDPQRDPGHRRSARSR